MPQRPGGVASALRQPLAVFLFTPGDLLRRDPQDRAHDLHPIAGDDGQAPHGLARIDEVRIEPRERAGELRRLGRRADRRAGVDEAGGDELPDRVAVDDDRHRLREQAEVAAVHALSPTPR